MKEVEKHALIESAMVGEIHVHLCDFPMGISREIFHDIE